MVDFCPCLSGVLCARSGAKDVGNGLANKTFAYIWEILDFLLVVESEPGFPDF